MFNAAAKESKRNISWNKSCKSFGQEACNFITVSDKLSGTLRTWKISEATTQRRKWTCFPLPYPIVEIFHYSKQLQKRKGNLAKLTEKKNSDNW